MMYINNDIDYLKYLKDKKIIIFGAGIEGIKSCQRLISGGYQVAGFCDNDVKKQGHPLCGTAVMSFEQLQEENDDSTTIIICGKYEMEIRNQLLKANVHNFISVSQIDFGGGEEHYDLQYFSERQEMGMFGGRVKADLFRPYIKEGMTVIDFGSGGGYLLENITAREKIGIEVNDAAREAAREIGIKSVKRICDVPDGYADIIISTHTLEHVENPLGALRELRNKLKENGKAVFHVPNESCSTEYVRSEPNNHLYTWNCLTLGNLFKAAGYFVHSVQNVQEVWPKHYPEIGWESFR